MKMLGGWVCAGYIACMAAGGDVRADAPPAALELDTWTGLRADSSLESEGKPALLWPNIGEITTVAAVNAPTDLTPFETLSFRVHVREPTDSVLTLIFSSENPETEGADYYSVVIPTDFSGWRQVRISRRRLGAARSPRGWDHIDRIFMNSRWAHKLDPATVVHFSPLILDPEPIPGMEPEPGELLPNRGFEVGGVGVPSGWSGATFGTETRLSIDTEQAHTGTQSARIDGAPGANRGGFSKGIPPKDTDPDAVYLMTAWVKVEGSTESSLGTCVRFTSVNADGTVIKSDYRKCAPGPFDWRFHTWLVALPETTERFNIVLFHHGDGTAWWDDVSLRPARRVPAIAPAPNSVVDDPHPEFRWQAPAQAAGTLVITSTSGDSLYREIPVTGNHHRLETPLPRNRGYRWFVIIQDGNADQLAVFTQNANPNPGEFYAGSWEERLRSKLGDLNNYRELYTKLEPLAEQNGMWDPFGLLGHILQTAENIEKHGTLPDNTTEEKLMADLAELQLRTPWWRKIFLGNKELFEALKLDLPDLAKVKASVDEENYAQARSELLRYYRQRETPSYYRKWEARPPINPARTSDIKADQLLTHQMPIHSYETPTFDLTREFNWHVFPIVDVEWPTKIHRHFHWSSLANAYWGTGNDSYAKEIALQLLDWGQDNPMERWDRKRHRWAWSTLNATVRIYNSWINAWLRVRSSEAWTADVQFTMLALLREHGQFLMTHHAKTGNWVVAEARGLVELGIMFPEFREAAEWRAEGFRRLRREIDIQVLPDGIHVERTPGYHSMTLSCFLQPIKLALLNDVSFEGKTHFLEKIESMYELYLYGSRPDRRMAQIGDAGNMSVVSLLRRSWDMFGREDMLFVATGGDAGKPPVHRSYAFESGGFYVSRSAWADPDALWSIMDWGGAVGHCHEDMGQICLSAYGAPLLVDSGRYSYAWPMRKYFHWTVGHNTVMVDQKPQKRRDPLACRWISCDHFDLTRGLTDNSEPLLHERTLVFKQPAADAPGYWVVLDRLTGPGTHRLDQRWHASEKMSGRLAGQTIGFRGKPDSGKHPSLTVAALPQNNLNAAIDQGWVSYKWYHKEPVDVAQFTLQTDMPAVFVTVLYPTPAGQTAPELDLKEIPAQLEGNRVGRNRVTAFEISAKNSHGATRNLWLFRHAEKGIVNAGDMQLNGRMARVDLTTPETSWSVAETASLMIKGRNVLDARKHIDAVSRRDNDIVASNANQLSVASDTPCSLNGKPAQPPIDGRIAWTNVAAPEAPTPPKAFEQPRVDVPPPPEAVSPTGFAAMLPPEAAAPSGALLVNAANLVDQGGGAVEPTSRKVGAEGRAFLHWDHAGHWLEYALEVPKAGTYRLLLRACTAQSAATRKITINGTVPDGCDAQEMAGTGGYSSNRDDWRSFAVADLKARPLALELPAGSVRIRLENVDGRSLNLNWLALVPEKTDQD